MLLSSNRLHSWGQGNLIETVLCKYIWFCDKGKHLVHGESTQGFPFFPAMFPTM